jgi:hypothetical protein
VGQVIRLFVFRGFYGRETGTRVDKVASKGFIAFPSLACFCYFLSSKGAIGESGTDTGFQGIGWKWAVGAAPWLPLDL